MRTEVSLVYGRRTYRFLKVTQIAQITQILICAVLDGEGADDGTGDGDKVLGYLDDFVPIDFHFTQNKFKRNTLLIKSPAEIKEMAEIL